ncbi:hypothetical protein HER32_06580 [Hymenobacter sp. BT18]|uniref:hypothetical protein n=1 Tax=Hymenobacter sp. BT18 TaxID=2835648 RepID=UPI00143EA688|nr:hypothetical protein [Hymenobacter sp. BT18]QIX60858.1 hypothetical protein HER32_06580 [Hymenobacter sp. BT18]
MATEKETREVEIILKGQQANATLKEMGAAAAIMNNQLAKMATDDPRRAQLINDHARLRDRIRETATEMRTYVKSAEEVREETERLNKANEQVILNGKKVTASFSEMKASAGLLERQLHELSADDPARERMLRDYQLLQQRIDAVKREMGETAATGGFFKNAMSNALGFLTGGGLLELAGTAFNFLKEAKDDFAGAAQAGAQLEATLESTGQAAGVTKKQIEDLASARMDVTLIDDDDTKAAASLLLTFTNIKDGVFQEALPAIQDLATKMGGDGPADMKGASIQLGKALNDPIKGITALSRVGVSFSAEQKTMIERLVATGDTAGAQRIILAELNKEFGGSATKAREAAGAMGTLSMQMADTKETIGEFVTDGLNRTVEWLGRVWEKSQPVRDIFVSLWTESGKLVDELVDIARGLGLVDEKTDTAGMAAEALRVVFTLLLFPIRTLVSICSALADGFITIYNKSEVLRGALGGLSAYFISIFKGLKDAAIQYLGGLGDFLTGVFTLDPEKIKKGMISMLSSMKDAALDNGLRAGEAFMQGYEDGKGRRITRTRSAASSASSEGGGAAASTGEEDNSMAEAAAAKLEKEAAAAERKREALERKRQAALAKAAQARIDAAKLWVKQEEQIEDARILAMSDKTERERAKIMLDADRKVRALTGNELDYTAQVAEIVAGRDRLLQDLWEKGAEEDAKRKKDELERRLADEDAAEVIREAEIQAKFEDMLLTEAQRDQALYDQRHASLEAKLALEEMYFGKESETYRKTFRELLKLEKDHNKEVVADTKKREEAKRQFAQLGLQVAGEVLATTISYLGQDEQARKKNADMIKAFTSAKIVLDGVQEVQGIWKNYNANATINALFPGAGAVLAAVQTGIAAGRTAIAINQVQNQKFASGGATGGGMSAGSLAVSPWGSLLEMSGIRVNNSGKMVDDTGFAVAGVVHEEEYVIPKWLREDPQVMQVEGWLEQRRLRGYADGGATTDGGSQVPAGGIGTTSESAAVLGQLVEVMQELNGRLAGVEQWQSKLKVVQDLREVTDGVDDVKKVRQESSVS